MSNEREHGPLFWLLAVLEVLADRASARTQNAVAKTRTRWMAREFIVDNE